MPQKGFRKMLQTRQEKVGSLLCVGLDPLPERVPECIKAYSDWRRILAHMQIIVDATAPFACMFKPQSAYYEALDGNGRALLQILVDYIKRKYPDIPVFLDCKRGDIDRTQERYGYAHLIGDGVDGMNFSPYMGGGCMKDLIRKGKEGAAIVGLGRTSNPPAWQIQDAPLAAEVGFARVWEYVVHSILGWAREFEIVENAGVVMGAAHPAEQLRKCIHYVNQLPGFFDGIFSYHLERARSIVEGNLWFLIPGVGKQGGAVRETVRASFMGYGSIAVNSSSGIIFASSGDEFAEAAAKEAERTRDELNAAIAS